MNIEDFFKKYPGKTINDYYSFMQKNTSTNNFENIGDQNDVLGKMQEKTGQNKIERHEDNEVKSAKSTAFFWIVGGLILLFLTLKIFPNKESNLSEGEELAEKAKRCLELRTTNRPVFESCQKEIREEAEKLDSIELEKYKTIILNEAMVELNNDAKSDFNLMKSLSKSFILFVFLAYLAVVIITWTFFRRIESNFENFKIIEKKLDNILLFYQSNPESYKKVEKFQTFAFVNGLFNNDRKYCYRSIIFDGIQDSVPGLIFVSLYTVFAIPYISKFLNIIEFTHPNLYLVLNLITNLFPLWLIIGMLVSINHDIVNPIKNVQDEIDHYDRITKINNH
jgi:hypothetical protein